MPNIRAVEKTTLSEELELVAKEAARAMYENRKKVLNAVGERPFGGENISQADRLARFGGMRNDAVAWAQILPKIARVKEDGRVLINKKALAEIQGLEGELRKGMLLSDGS